MSQPFLDYLGVYTSFQHQSSIDLTPEQFYERLAQGKILPVTSVTSVLKPLLLRKS